MMNRKGGRGHKNKHCSKPLCFERTGIPGSANAMKAK